MENSKKITLSTVKSFIKKNKEKLLINVHSSFDGMTDGLEFFKQGFKLAENSERHPSHNLGVNGAWFVGQSRDYFRPFENEKLIGIEVSNSCGNFTLAIEK